MGEDVRSDIRGLVTNSFTEGGRFDSITGDPITGFSSRTTAKRLKSFIGLTKPQENARKVFERGLVGLSPGKAKRALDRWMAKSLRSRSRTIARTESMDVLNRGINKAWRQGMDEGAIPDGMLKVWILSPDELLCPICSEMQGKTVPANKEFSNGDPPAHPNCRCTTGLVSGEESDVLRRVRAITADANMNGLFTEGFLRSTLYSAPGIEEALALRATFLKRQKAIRRKGLNVMFPRGTMHGTLDKIANRQMIAVVDTSMKAMEEAFKNGNFAAALKHWNKLNKTKLSVKYGPRKGSALAWFKKASFPDFKPSIHINMTQADWTSWEAITQSAQESFASGHWVSPYPESIIHHEAGHAFHSFNNPANFFNLGAEYRSKENWLKAGQNILPSGKDLLGRPTGETITSLVGRTQRNIFTDVSGYGATDPLEFVAESYVKQITPLSPDIRDMAVPRPDVLPPELQSLYDIFGGYTPE